jgi:hypothetical protein
MDSAYEDIIDTTGHLDDFMKYLNAIYHRGVEICTCDDAHMYKCVVDNVVISSREHINNIIPHVVLVTLRQIFVHRRAFLSQRCRQNGSLSRSYKCCVLFGGKDSDDTYLGKPSIYISPTMEPYDDYIVVMLHSRDTLDTKLQTVDDDGLKGRVFSADEMLLPLPMLSYFKSTTYYAVPQHLLHGRLIVIDDEYFVPACIRVTDVACRWNGLEVGDIVCTMANGSVQYIRTVIP